MIDFTRPRQRWPMALALGLSMCLHLLALLPAWPDAAPPHDTPLTVRLELATSSAAGAAPAAPPVAAPMAAPAALPVPVPGVVAAVAGMPAPPSVAAGGGVPGAALGAGQHTELLAEVQLRYATAMPPPVMLEYAVEGGGSASLRWEVGDDARYRLTMRGPQGAAGSSGSIGDSGIAPDEAWHEGANRTLLRFDRASHSLASTRSARSYPIIDSALDPWALLLQLAAVGAASPERLRAPIVFYVGGMEGVATVRFEPAGSATLATALGAIDTEHLVQTAPAGAGRLEVWLAPQHHYLPVQLRRVDANGRAVTHSVRALELLAPN